MQVFMSYTRSKDQFGAVSDFGAHFAQELELHSPGSTVFQDTKQIETGQRFPEVQKRELLRSDALLMLVSPAWLRSAWCRYKFNTFANVGLELRNMQRMLPVLWVQTPLSLDSADSVNRALAAMQFDDWTHLRHQPWTDSESKERIAELAARAPALETSRLRQKYRV
jgi:hypothetical protein